MITLVFADNHTVTRAGIRTILSQAPDIQIVGEADNGFEVQGLVDRFRPQILLLDLNMPGPTPIVLGRWVRTHCPKTATLILTAYDRDSYLAVMIDSGVVGLIGKNESAERIIGAIRRAARGEILFDNRQLNRARLWREIAGVRWESLTDRERQVLQQLVQGSDRMETASKLEIVPKTVDYHIANILKKLEVKSHKEAVCWVHKYLYDDLGLIMG